MTCGEVSGLHLYPLVFTFFWSTSTDFATFRDKANERHTVHHVKLVLFLWIPGKPAWINACWFGHVSTAVLTDCTEQISDAVEMLLAEPGLALRRLITTDPNGVASTGLLRVFQEPRVQKGFSG